MKKLQIYISILIAVFGPLFLIAQSDFEARWNINECGSSAFEDVENGIILQTLEATTVEGYNGVALQFDGANSYGAIENIQPYFSGGQLSLNFWLKAGVQENAVLFSNTNRTNSNFGWELLSGNGTDAGKLVFRIYANESGSLYKEVRTTIDVLDNSWHNITVVFGEDNATFITDGVENNYSSIHNDSFNMYHVSSENILLGNAKGNETVCSNFSGVIDEIFLANRMLSMTEISALTTIYHAPLLCEELKSDFATGQCNATRKLKDNITAPDKGTGSLYKFQVEKLATNQKEVITKETNAFQLGELKTILENGNDYLIKVQNNKAGVWSEVSNGCLVTSDLNSYSPVKLKDVFCSKSDVGVNEVLKANQENNAVAYEFLIENNVLKSKETYLSKSNELKWAELKKKTFNNAEYDISVRPILHTGTKTSFGQKCRIKTNYEIHPLTYIDSSSVDLDSVALADKIKAKKVRNASEYEFLITNVALGFSESILSNENEFKLEELIGVVLDETEYSIQVRTTVNNLQSEYGPEIIIKTYFGGVTTSKVLDLYSEIDIHLNTQVRCGRISNAEEYTFLLFNNKLKYSEEITTKEPYFSVKDFNVLPYSGQRYMVKVKTKTNGVYNDYGGNTKLYIDLEKMSLVQLLPEYCYQEETPFDLQLVSGKDDNATQYEFWVTNPKLKFEEKYIANKNSFSFMELTQNVEGSTSYNIRVRPVNVYGNGGEFGKECTVITEKQQVKYTYGNPSMYNPEGGWIELDPRSTYAPFQYKWDIGVDYQNVYNLSAGKYGVTVVNSRGEEFRLDIPILIDISMVEMMGLTGDPESLKHTSGDIGFGRSENVIGASDDGLFVAVVGDKTTDFSISLTEQFQYASYLKSNFTLFAKEGILFSNISGVDKTPVTALDQFGNKIKVNKGDRVIVRKKIVGKEVVISFIYKDYVFRKYSSTELIKQKFLAAYTIEKGGELQKLSGIFTLQLFAPVKLCLTWSESQHYIDDQVYNENGALVGHTRKFFDKLGRLVQIQSEDFENHNIIASQTTYDEYGREAIQTLSAPIFKQGISCYYDKFFTNQEGNEYSYKDFRGKTEQNYPGEINNPRPAGFGLQGSLGWYYSNNNTVDSYIAASSFPFYEVEYYSDPLNRVKRVAKAGNNLKMGRGKESKMFYLEDGGEVAYVSQSYPNKMLNKVVSVDANGETSVSYTDRKGRLIAMARSGLASECLPQKVVSTMEYSGTKSASIHIPESGKNKVYLSLDLSRGVTIDDILLSIIDLETGKELEEGVDYSLVTVSSAKHRINFSIGNYALGQNFFKFSFEYGFEFQNAYWQNNFYPSSLDDQYIVYELDYSEWSVNQFDPNTDQLVKTISPKGVDCGQYDPTVNYDWEYATYYSDPLDINNNFDIGTNVYSTSQYLDANNTNFDATTQDHKVYLTFSSYGLVIEPGVDVNGDPIDPCTLDPNGGTTEIATPGIIGSQQIYAANLSGWTDVQEYINYSASDNISLNGDKYVNSYLNEEALLLKAMGGGSVVIDPDPCEGIPDEVISTFKYSIVIYAGNQQVDRTGMPSSMIYHFYPRLMKTCECEYYWDLSSFESLVIWVDNDLLDQSAELRIELVDVQVATGMSNSYGPLNPANPYHAMGSFMSFITHYKHFIKPEVQVIPQIGYATEMTYNDLDQMVSYTSEDEGTIQYVYDRKGNLRFTQNALQASDNKFSYTNYDRQGRVIETGEYNTLLGSQQFQVPANSYTYPQSQGAVPVLAGANTSILDIVDQVDGLNDYACSEQKHFVYDVVDWPYGTIGGAPFDLLTYKQTFTSGKMSKSWNDESTTWYSYDEYSRLKWTIQYINDLASYKTVHYEYDLLGNVLEVAFQKDDQTEAFTHFYNYDNNRRLKEVYTSETDVVGVVPQAVNKYNLNGSLKRKEIGGNLQGIDYTYTINGWLKSINNANTDYDPGKDGMDGANADFAKDIFSLTLDYFSEDYSRRGTFIGSYGDLLSDGTHDKGLYNGMITSERWRTRTDTKPLTASVNYDNQDLLYTYKYNHNYELTEAKFGVVNDQGTQNTNVLNYAYSVQFDKFGNVIPGSSYNGPTASIGEDYHVDNITYDPNGNIQTLKRNGAQALAGLDMDNFEYEYVTGKNQLNRINDLVSASGGYQDIKSQGANNYEYNVIGQCVADALQGNYFTYNSLGLVVDIFQNAAHSILKSSYEYDERGNRQKEMIYDLNGVLSKEVYYVRDVSGRLLSMYEKDYGQSSPTVAQTDIAIYGGDRIGFFSKVDGTSKYELHDQKGSVRAVVSYNDALGILELINMADYYPYGMVMPGRSYESGEGYFFKFGGQKFDANVGLTNYPLRMYEARTGRFISPDPMRQFYSPYLANFNNPVNFMDPSGGESEGIQSAEDAYRGWDKNLRDLAITWGLPGEMISLKRMYELNYDVEFKNFNGKYGFWLDYTYSIKNGDMRVRRLDELGVFTKFITMSQLTTQVHNWGYDMYMTSNMKVGLKGNDPSAPKNYGSTVERGWQGLTTYWFSALEQADIFGIIPYDRLTNEQRRYLTPVPDAISVDFTGALFMVGGSESTLHLNFILKGSHASFIKPTISLEQTLGGGYSSDLAVGASLYNRIGREMMPSDFGTGEGFYGNMHSDENSSWQGSIAPSLLGKVGLNGGFTPSTDDGAKWYEGVYNWGGSFGGSVTPGLNFSFGRSTSRVLVNFNDN